MDYKNSVSIIIVSFNTNHLTKQCLLSLVPGIENFQAEIIVVDNCSNDGSQAMIRSDFPNVRLLELAQNIGFGPANNRGAAVAQGEFLLLLNSDTVVHPGAIAGLMEFASQHPEVVAVGPRLLNGDGTLQKGCWRFPSLIRLAGDSVGLWRLLRRPGNYLTSEYEETHPVDFIIGACMLIRREAFEKAGGFDENFFMYAEETDLCRRLEAQGGQTYYYPHSRVTHLGGGSQVSPGCRSAQFQTSQELYYKKYYGRLGLAAYKIIFSFSCGLRWLLWWSLMLVRPGHKSQWREKAELTAWLLAWNLGLNRKNGV